MNDRDINDLFYETVLKEDFESNFTENFMEMSRQVYRVLMISELSYEVRMNYDIQELLFRNEFRLKVVHNLENTRATLIEDIQPDVVLIQELEYLAFRYVSRNGRIRYVDWKGNPDSWR